MYIACQHSTSALMITSRTDRTESVLTNSSALFVLTSARNLQTAVSWC